MSGASLRAARAMAMWRAVDADTEALYTAVDEWFEDADYGSVT